MTDSPAYYDLSGDSGGGKLPAGNYEAIIVDMDTVTDIKCGVFIADVFKPVYRVTAGDHKNMEVTDNGILGINRLMAMNMNPIRIGVSRSSCRC